MNDGKHAPEAAFLWAMIPKEAQIRIRICAMNKNSLPSALGFVLVGALLTGCAAPRPKTSAVPPQRTAITSTNDEPVTPREIIYAASLKPLSLVAGDGWRSLFDGSSLDGWGVTHFGGDGRVELRERLLVFGIGAPFTGVNYTNALPKLNYEVTLEAMRIEGDDFFCGLTFPVGDSFLSLIVGGWGGRIVGISSLDDSDASDNETTQLMDFETGRWYRIRLHVTEQKIEAWIDQKQLVNVMTTEHKLSLRAGDIELSKPFGLASWVTGAAYRDIKIRSIPSDPAE